jgi:osmotically-inducible protein OsmY
MMVQRFPLRTLTVAAAALIGLVACDRRQEDRSAGRSVDSTIARAEQKSQQVADDVKQDIDAARVAAGQVVDAAGSKVTDAVIATNVNAALARDSSLSVLTIDVDTNNGHVALRGTAPDAAARERAAQLARGVDGVVAVANYLQVSAKRP